MNRVQHSEMIPGTHDLMQMADDGWIVIRIVYARLLDS